MKKLERCFTCCIISYQKNLHVTKYLNLLIQSFPNLEQCRMKTTWYLWQQYNLLTFNQLHIATTFYFLIQTPISVLPVLLLWYPMFCLLDFWIRLCDSIFIGYYSYADNFIMPLRTSLAMGTVLLNGTLKVEFCFKIWVKKYWEPLQQEASTCCAGAKHHLTREVIREEFATTRSWGGAATQGGGDSCFAWSAWAGEDPGSTTWL